ncbi:hypothetical protein BK126_01090 [Paenibacillus sp. FSL H7-0326]|uniref:DUF4179 domain-containing protein n=1 Tax=Paenibacillus sp. FSL H7-0326 TaxID=1921144 RepID=UPI00096F30E2|nr:DUF4179 domain-containing protein [Paenibacillus sp. FSL H7-0326]OMC70748.1 hypothetical protein BK126_01090 [Paenibacillus sp. FSL H7-0326]
MPSKKSNKIVLLTTVVTLLLVVGLTLAWNVIWDEDLNRSYSPEMVKYLEPINDNRTLMLAAENNLLQEIHQSDTSGEYQLTLGGIIADEENAVILYSLSGPDLNGKLNEYSVELISDEELHYAAPYFNPSIEEDATKSYMTYQVQLSSGEVFPQNMGLVLRLGEQELKVDFSVDHSRFAGLRKKVLFNREIPIDNQTVLLREMELLPLRTTIRLETLQSNKKQVNDLFALSLIDDTGQHQWNQSELSSGSLSEGMYTANFDGLYFEDPEQLYLISEGVYASDKNMTMIINSETKKIIEAPDEHLQLLDILENEEYMTIKLRLDNYEFPGPSIQNDISLLTYGGVFIDALGKQFKLLNPEIELTAQISAERDKHTHLYHYYIPNEEYQQPLTFPIYEYTGYKSGGFKIPLY